MSTAAIGGHPSGAGSAYAPGGETGTMLTSGDDPGPPPPGPPPPPRGADGGTPDDLGKVPSGTLIYLSQPYQGESVAGKVVGRRETPVPDGGGHSTAQGAPPPRPPEPPTAERAQSGRPPADGSSADGATAGRVPADPTPADPVSGERAPGDGAPADRVPGERVPAERAPGGRAPAELAPADGTGPAAPRAEAGPASLPRSSLLPATMSANSPPALDGTTDSASDRASDSASEREAAQPSAQGRTEPRSGAAEPPPAGHDRTHDRAGQSRTDDPALPAPHAPRAQDTVRDTAQAGDPQASPLTRTPSPDPAGRLPDPVGRPSDQAGPLPDRGGPLPDRAGHPSDQAGPLPDQAGPLPDRAGPQPDPGGRVPDGTGATQTAVAGPVTVRPAEAPTGVDRPSEAALADPPPATVADVAAVRPRPADPGGPGRPLDTPVTGPLRQGDPGPSAARSRALPDDLGQMEPATRRVAALLSQDGQYRPVSALAWQTSYATAVKGLMDSMRSSTKDMLAGGQKQGLRERVGDPGFYLVLTERHVVGRTIRTWLAVDRNSLTDLAGGPGEPAQDRRILRQMPFDSPEALETARRLAVDELLKSWGFGAGEILPPRLAMNLAAADEFGLTNLVDLQTYGDPSRNRTARKYHASNGDMRRDFLRRQYELSQRELARYGIEELVLYRGIRLDQGHPIAGLNGVADGEVVQAPPGLPLQSWSATPGVAKRYTLGEGVVMAGVFPASRVLATPWTGMGQLPLGEFVLLAGPGEVTVRHPPHVVPADPGAASLPPGWQVAQSGNRWTECALGHSHQGTEGRAGLLAYHRVSGDDVRVLMQLRSMETDHGGPGICPAARATAARTRSPPLSAGSPSGTGWTRAR
ncbi:hypothetical protein ACFQYP_23340 [Nonomuraea antimicrobica]